MLSFETHLLGWKEFLMESFTMQRIGITITGFPGSGSTTLGNSIAEKLGWPRPFYSGGVVRWLIGEIERRGREALLKMSSVEILDAMERGKIELQPELFKKYHVFPKEFDQMVDAVQKELLAEKQVGVHEGRTAWFFAKTLHSEGRAPDKRFINILCTVQPEIGALRLLMRPEYKNTAKTAAEIVMESAGRVKIERERYKELYDIEDHLNHSHFDIVIDTTNLTQDEACSFALQELKRLYPILF